MSSGKINYTYKNALAQTVTGTINDLTGLAGMLAIIGVNTNNTYVYTDSNGNRVGLITDCLVAGTSVCGYHVNKASVLLA